MCVVENSSSYRFPEFPGGQLAGFGSTHVRGRKLFELSLSRVSGRAVGRVWLYACAWSKTLRAIAFQSFRAGSWSFYHPRIQFDKPSLNLLNSKTPFPRITLLP
ncbi:uncharacterized protein LOC125455467 isoform X2 [Stegostoma tigrinum]|uniref:uncharacterized protein LOC125455467 isoform X2 n=1 Tax=Stegostoma tigrinum TaxID=3053191 RepID=UPI0028700780|nr:uncharacterized protein LOC125455467 isoform X2 [Stegostoma tigrinum]